MSQKICDTSYAQGRRAFEDGGSLRSIIEHVIVAENEPANEIAAFSRALGFADALIDRVRNAPAVVISSKAVVT